MRTSLNHQDDAGAGQAGSKLADTSTAVTAEPALRPDWSDWRTWPRSPLIQGVLALALYTTVWLLTGAHEIVHNLSDAHLTQVSMDPNFYTWCLRWWPYALEHGQNPLYTHMVGAPSGQSLAWVTTVPPIALLAAPATLLAGPIATFNVLTAIALPLAAWAAFVMCRRLTKQFWPSLAGGVVFGFSAYQMNHEVPGQLNLIYSLMLPILGYLIVRWYEQSISTRAFVILAGITMALQIYLFLETFADLTGFLAVSLLVGIAVAGRAGRPAMVRFSKSLAVAYGIAVVLALPYLAYALAIHPGNLNAPRALDLVSLVVPRPATVEGITWLHHLASEPEMVSAAGYVGVPLLVLAVALAVTRWSSKLVRFLTCMLVFVFVASLGPALDVAGSKIVRFPWSPLWNLPILRNAYPARLMVFAYLILAIATALFLARHGKLLWLRWPLGVLVIAAVVQDAPPIGVTAHSTVPAFITKGTYQRHLKPGEIVVVVSTIGNAGMLWQADTNFYTRLAGGYINQAITDRSDLPKQVQSLAKATPQTISEFQAYVKHDKIGAILVDGNHEPQWVGVFKKMGLRGRLIGNVVVYSVNGCRTCHGLSPAQIGPPRTAQS
jgi:hypothetical protein